MKAVAYSEYGPPEVLQLTEMAVPQPGAGEVLVKIQAASVNYADWSLVRGKPFLVRLMQGVFKPKNQILGSDIAGIVEAVGEGVTQFAVGDEVYGDISGCGWGGFAEYVAVPQEVLAPKPARATFAEAAAVPQAGVVALQGLRDAGEIQPGQKVLIHGASGGIGTFAVQLAKYFGAEVTGVCSTRNVEMVRALGADHVIDYTKEDFSRNGEQYDVILTVAGARSVRDYERALSETGVYVGSVGSQRQVMATMILGPWITRGSEKRMINLMHKAKQEDLRTMTELIDAGDVKAVVERCYPLSETAQAVRAYGAGHTRGKIVVTMAGA